MYVCNIMSYQVHVCDVIYVTDIHVPAMTSNTCTTSYDIYITDIHVPAMTSHTCTWYDISY